MTLLVVRFQREGPEKSLILRARIGGLERSGFDEAANDRPQVNKPLDLLALLAWKFRREKGKDLNPRRVAPDGDLHPAFGAVDRKGAIVLAQVCVMTRPDRSPEGAHRYRR